jgi:hypothetical protein
MKKGALLLYGELRSYKKASKYLVENLLKSNDIDIFISTHKIYNDNFQNVYGNYLKCINFIEENEKGILDLINNLKNKFKLIDPDKYYKYESEINEIKNLNDFNIIYKKLNPQRYEKNQDGYQYLLHENIQLYHRLNAFNLCLEYKLINNVDYDYIIIYRPDLYFKNKLNCELIDVNDSKIYYRHEFMFISSVEGIKKLVYKLYNDYYNQKDTDKYIKNIQDKNYIKYWQNLSEWQHEIFFYNQANYKINLNILNSLNHCRALEGENNLDQRLVSKLSNPDIEQTEFEYILEKNFKL